MNTSAIEIAASTAESVILTNDTLTVELSDGRSLSVPLDWFPRLVHATQAERKRWRLIGRGRGIHWDLLDENIGVDGLLAGKPSAESQGSFQNMARLPPRHPIQTNGFPLQCSSELATTPSRRRSPMSSSSCPPPPKAMSVTQGTGGDRRHIDLTRSTSR